MSSVVSLLVTLVFVSRTNCDEARCRIVDSVWFPFFLLLLHQTSPIPLCSHSCSPPCLSHSLPPFLTPPSLPHCVCLHPIFSYLPPYLPIFLSPYPSVSLIVTYLNTSKTSYLTAGSTLHHYILYVYRAERSTDQVIKPVNLEALTKWVDAIPSDVKQDMNAIAPMLAKLGYDPNAYPPHYGDASQFVSDNTHNIKTNEDYWRKRTRAIQNGIKPKRTYSFHAKGDVKFNSSVLNAPPRPPNGASAARQTEKTIDILGSEDKTGFGNDNVDR